MVMNIWSHVITFLLAAAAKFSLSSFIKFPIDEESEELDEELERMHWKSNNYFYSGEFFLWDYKPVLSPESMLFLCCFSH